MDSDEIGYRTLEFLPAGAARPTRGEMCPDRLFLVSGEFSLHVEKQLLIGKMRIQALHIRLLPFGGARNARQRSGERQGYGAEGHIENLADLPIAQAFGPQKKALAILVRQRFDHRHYTLPSLPVRETIFRIGSGIDGPLFATRIQLRLRIAARPVTPAQSQIVRYTVQPATNILDRLAAIHMPEQRKEYVLEYLFAVRNLQAESPQVTKQRFPELVEDRRDFLVQLALFIGALRR